MAPTKILAGNILLLILAVLSFLYVSLSLFPLGGTASTFLGNTSIGKVIGYANLAIIPLAVVSIIASWVRYVKGFPRSYLYLLLIYVPLVLSITLSAIVLLAE